MDINLDQRTRLKKLRMDCWYWTCVLVWLDTRLDCPLLVSLFPRMKLSLHIASSKSELAVCLINIYLFTIQS